MNIRTLTMLALAALLIIAGCRKNIQDTMMNTNILEASEKNITFESQEGYPISGTLTMPHGGAKAAVVLIHGSGPNDRDESVGANKPFRDLSHGLAEKGIAVLRYDKITYTYGRQIASGPNYPRLTVEQEVVVDAANAFKFLQTQPGINADKIFLLGHSLGGGLLSYIGTDAAGYVIMGGTPRKFWEISYDQNMDLISGMEAAGMKAEVEQGKVLIESEMAKTKELFSKSDDDLLNETIFGMPTIYLKHLGAIDPVKLHMADGKPVLVLHGAKDRQIYIKDYELWQGGLKSHPDAQFRLYENLNHLFGEYTGEPVEPMELVSVEYAHSTPVPAYVIKDIAEWILERSK